MSVEEMTVDLLTLWTETMQLKTMGNRGAARVKTCRQSFRTDTNRSLLSS